MIYSRSSEAEGDKESEGTQERFWSDSILMQLHTKEVLVLPPPPKSISTTFSLVFDRNITSKTTFPPFRVLSMMLFFFHFATFSPRPLSLSCFHNKFDLDSFFTIRPIVLRKRTTLREWHGREVYQASCVWSQAPKESVEGTSSRHHPSPLLLHLVPSALIWRRRRKVRAYGDEAMLIMLHHIWCAWSVCGQPGRRFDQPLTRWFFTGSRRHMAETHDGTKKNMRALLSQRAEQGNEKVHLLPCCVLRKKKILSKTLNCVWSTWVY